MVISDNNKGSYFLLEITIPNIGFMEKELIRKTETQLDIILAAITATSNVYKFESFRNEKILYLFSTRARKRKGQLEKLIETKLCEKKLIDDYKVTALLKREFNIYKEDLKAKETLRITSEPIKFEGYEGNDIKFFEDQANWYRWQKQIYEMLFLKTGTVKKPDPRKIIALYDPEGATGKSSFFKYLYFKFPEKIARFSYSSAQQLRSSLVNLSAHEIYLIDLVRTKGRSDSELDIISTIEDAKNGLIFSGMYGAGHSLIMEPPHIIFSANYIPDLQLLSKDRWDIYEIKNKELVNITKKEVLKQKTDNLKKK